MSVRYCGKISQKPLYLVVCYYFSKKSRKIKKISVVEIPIFIIYILKIGAKWGKVVICRRRRVSVLLSKDEYIGVAIDIFING